MPRLSGLQLLEKIEAERLGVLTVLMTGLRHGRDRDRGDEEGRLRLPPQAVQGRGGHPRRRARAVSPAPAGREHPAARGADDLQGLRGDRAVARHRAHPRRRPARRARRGQGRRRDAAPARPAHAATTRSASSSLASDGATAHRPALARVRRAARAVRAGRADPRARRQGVAVLHRDAQRRRAVVVRRGAAAGARRHGRRAQRVLVHAGQEVRRGPPQDARGARVARRERDRQRAALRRAARDATTT